MKLNETWAMIILAKKKECVYGYDAACLSRFFYETVNKYLKHSI